MKKAIDLNAYKEMKKLGVYTRYFWRWNNNGMMPEKWLVAYPIRIFGFTIGMKVEVVRDEYEKYFFTNVV